ncbi:hypothetical protein, partial [Rhodovulum strictum]
MTVLAVHRPPFAFEPQVAWLPEGLSLLEMVGRMRGLPAGFSERGIICINGHPVPRAAWALVRPKAQANGQPVEVTFHAPPAGGGRDGKNVFAVVASFALMAATGWIAGGGLKTAGGLFAAGSPSATLLAAGVSYAGSLLLSSLVSTPMARQQQRKTRNPGDAGAAGNLLEANAPVPRVVGEMKVFPPLAAEPLVYFDGPDEVVEAAFVLAGPHRIEDIRVGTAELGTLSGVDYEVREGWPGDRRISLLRRQARTEALQTELRGHQVGDDGLTLDSATGDTASALPQAVAFATRDAPDEHWLHLVFPGGLHRNGDDGLALRVPLRLRMRRLGTENWIDLPELHFQGSDVRQMRSTIRLMWADDATTSPGASQGEGWVHARVTAPGQTIAPASASWAAHPYFAGAGDPWLDAGNIGGTGVRHVIMSRYEARIMLDPAVFPKGRYQIEIRRGAAFRASTFSAAGYTVGGSVWDFWGVRGTPGQIVYSRNGVMDTLQLVRSVSVWNEHPFPTDALAIVAVRARNRNLESLSCRAGGYVRDWNGSAWAAWTVTDNPAPHLRAIWTGAQNLDPVPADIIDDDDLVQWRAACDDLGYRCNAIFDGQTVMEAAEIVAGCGYAKPRMSERWGVARDLDRSAEAPV